MEEPRIVTTSWDDGHPKDLELAELLRSRGLRGTFYIPFIGYDGGPTLATLNPGTLTSLVSEGFEVGAHGLSHHTLPQFRSRDLSLELGISKKRLEDILGAPVEMFCYPKGHYSANVVRHVKQAGYKGARTAQMLFTGLHFDPFKMPISLHAYPHPPWDYIKNAAKAGRPARLFRYATGFSQVDSWVELGRRLFDLVLREGGIWHLFGHSWEIEELGLWDALREMLDYVGRREGVLYVSNGEVLRLLRAR